ncbi:hypothetical protein BDK63_003520 [Halomonas campaniensis]|uniref:Uncharacterized protein n=1 Tax=Halomonas campaniensis TaxID=213554 RepID=A0A7W5K652_9GAMM|nr:hypothetical protein [Halomonas campaniensis]MBB3332622.1 hypothetical protein [Halomonas campaniensis]
MPYCPPRQARDRPVSSRAAGLSLAALLGAVIALGLAATGLHGSASTALPLCLGALARMLHRAGQTLPDLRLGEDIGATGLRLAIS